VSFPACSWRRYWEKVWRDTLKIWHTITPLHTLAATRGNICFLQCTPLSCTGVGSGIAGSSQLLVVEVSLWAIAKLATWIPSVNCHPSN
jgi:hypothetical protein